MKVFLFNRSDLKFEDGKFLLKRKYGSKFQREVFSIDTNTKEGQEILSQINKD